MRSEALRRAHTACPWQAHPYPFEAPARRVLKRAPPRSHMLVSRALGPFSAPGSHLPGWVLLGLGCTEFCTVVVSGGGDRFPYMDEIEAEGLARELRSLRLEAERWRDRAELWERRSWRRRVWAAWRSVWRGVRGELGD